ncbi:MAG: DUF1840 domain-containing protein [Rhodocyclales bacterium]|nr:DUF1840 domain-containing protein [Rhodocyclales bacterium]
MIVFRSEVGPDVMMFDEVAQQMMVLMGKEKAARGVVTVEQMAETIARLRAAVAADKAQHRGAAQEEEESGDAPARVSLAQRAVPLIELLEISLARKTPVLWGV